MLFSAVKDTLLDYDDRRAFVPELFVYCYIRVRPEMEAHIHVIITPAVSPTMMNG